MRVFYRLYHKGRFSQEHDFTPGKYNEFYLPSLTHDMEMRIFVQDDEGSEHETQIHLKR